MEVVSERMYIAISSFVFISVMKSRYSGVFVRGSFLIWDTFTRRVFLSAGAAGVATPVVMPQYNDELAVIIVIDSCTIAGAPVYLKPLFAMAVDVVKFAVDVGIVIVAFVDISTHAFAVTLVLPVYVQYALKYAGVVNSFVATVRFLLASVAIMLFAVRPLTVKLFKYAFANSTSAFVNPVTVLPGAVEVVPTRRLPVLASRYITAYFVPLEMNVPLMPMSFASAALLVATSKKFVDV